jgi:signal transduction histidine kinase
MKAKFFYLVLFYLALIEIKPVIAQTAKVDSLKNRLTTADNDSLRIRILSALSYNLMYIDYSSAKKYADDALELALKNDWNWAKSVAYSRQGFLGTIRGDHRRALEFDNKNLKIVMEENDSSRISIIYNDVGNDYLELGKYEEAYFYVTKSYEIAKKINDSQSAAIAMHNLAVLYSKLGRMDVALAYFEGSAKLSLAAKDDEGPAYNNHELGNAYILEKNYKKASGYLFSALSLSKDGGISILVPRIYQSIGDLLSLTGEPVKSLVYYDSAIRDFSKNQNSFGMAEAQLGKAKVFILQKKFSDADKLAQASLKTANELKAQILILECYQVLSKNAEHQADFKSALSYNQRALQTRDSLSSVNVMSQAFENEFQMRSQKKDEEIASLTKKSQQSDSELKRQEFIRNIFAVVFALTIVLLYSVYRSGRRKVEMNDLLILHQAEIEKRTQELEELNKVKDKFFSIISHDLRSPINSLAGLLDLMEKNEIKAEELPGLTKEMRVQFNHTKNLINNLLDWTLLQMNKVSIKKEKIVLKPLIDDNIRLLSSMSSKKTNIINEVDESLAAFADQNMINLVFRNLILNGIKFTDNGGVIKISATRGEKEITVNVKDNGVGISADVQQVLFDKTTGYSTRGTANEKGTGLGLILCKEFIERNGGKIWLTSEIGKGSTFSITIPVA